MKNKKTFFNYKFSLLVFSFIIFSFVNLPLVASAVDMSKSMVPCGWDGAHGGAIDGKLSPNEECQFKDFLIMINGIVTGTLIVMNAWAAVSFMYAGYAYLTSGGSQEKVSYAKGIFKKVLMGYIIILMAWAFVSMIEKALLNDTSNPSNGGSSFLQN